MLYKHTLRTHTAMKQPLPHNNPPPVWIRKHWIEIIILVGGLVAMNLIFIA